MKIGVSAYSFEKYRKATGCDFKEITRQTKKIGFDAIEYTEIRPEMAKDPVAYAKELRELCDSLGLTIASYTVGANLLSPEIEKEMERLFLCVDTAEALGVPCMRHDVCWELPEGKTWYEMVPVLAGRIRTITEYAEKKGIRTCSENHGYIYQQPERVETLIRAVGNKNYGWLVDIGNFLCADANPMDSVRIAAPYAVHAHIKDFLYRKVRPGEPTPEGFFKTANGNLLRGTIVGHGDVPVAECVRILRSSGYDKVFSIEFEGAEENIPALELGLAYLRKLAAEPVQSI